MEETYDLNTVQGLADFLHDLNDYPCSEKRTQLRTRNCVIDITVREAKELSR